MSEQKYNVLDLFCGCGGLSLGFEDAGYNVLLGIDIWEDALKTYAYNHKHSKTLCADMSTLRGEDVEEIIGDNKVDVIIGGPPCQGFSIAGKRIVNDDRNKLYKGFVRMVEYFKPKAFVMENVPNILSIGDGAIKDAIFKDFEVLGYKINVQVVLASNYGVPQNRRRAVFVGLLNGKEYEFPKPLEKPMVTSKEALDDLPEGTLSEGASYPTKANSLYQEYIREGSNGVFNHEITIHNDRTKEIIAMVPDGGNYKDLPVELQQTRKVHIAWTRLNSKKPSFTIDCGHNHHFHYLYNRVPTVRESARIQSFPDKFVFLGNKGSQLKQVGNAVPPLMAKAISQQLYIYMIMYTPEHQYRCTIIRGKSQTDMEDLLPLYANIVHKYCPCEETAFKVSARKHLSKALFETEAYDTLSPSNKKTIDNHLTEIAGTLLGLYYPQEEADGTIIYESESCKYLVENHDFPIFFKNLCLNFQFPNGAKWIQYIKEDIDKKLNIKPYCYVVSLLYHAEKQQSKVLLTQQEIGYYVLNNLDVLQGNVPCEIVYDRILEDRKNKVKREKLSGSKDWQHIKEQFNMLELANIIERDQTYVWLNPNESKSIELFLKANGNIEFDCYKYDLDSLDERKSLLNDWRTYNGNFHKELYDVKTVFKSDIEIVGRDGLKAQGGAFKSTVDLGDEGEALVFKLEQERIRNFKERLVNKVLLLGKTKGLGYDISSIEGDENPKKPEFARYIEVKSTKRVTEPSFDKNWGDSLNITAKEWVAAEQYGEYYNIYRVYFTKNKTLIVRIKNPFKKAEEGEIEVYPTIYQMIFDSSVIEFRYGSK